MLNDMPAQIVNDMPALVVLAAVEGRSRIQRAVAAMARIYTLPSGLPRGLSKLIRTVARTAQGSPGRPPILFRTTRLRLAHPSQRFPTSWLHSLPTASAFAGSSSVATAVSAGHFTSGPEHRIACALQWQRERGARRSLYALLVRASNSTVGGITGPDHPEWERRPAAILAADVVGCGCARRPMAASSIGFATHHHGCIGGYMSMESVQSELPPQVVFYHLATGHYFSHAHGLVAKLGIADLLKDGPRHARSSPQPLGRTRRRSIA